MKHPLNKAHRAGIARVVHATRVERHVPVPVGEAANPHAQSCGVGFDHACPRLDHVHGGATFLEREKARSVGLDAVVPGRQHRGFTGLQGQAP